MKEIQEAASLVQEQAHEDANIIFGASIDESLGENVKVTVIATGFDTQEREAAAEAQASRNSFSAQAAASQASRSLGGSVLRPNLGSAESVPPQNVRRPPPPPSRSQEAPHAAMASSAPRAPSREAARAGQDPFPGLDHDWDVPAFQRKGR